MVRVGRGHSDGEGGGGIGQGQTHMNSVVIIGSGH